MTWIPVEERLPADRQMVLTYWPECGYEDYRIGRHMYRVNSFDTAWWIGAQSLLVSDNRITHWQPLPKEPGQELWKRYKVRVFKGGYLIADETVVEAPCPGAAIDYVLACWGEEHWGQIELDETTDEISPYGFTKEDLLSAMPDVESRILELDGFYEWEVK